MVATRTKEIGEATRFWLFNEERVETRHCLHEQDARYVMKQFRGATMTNRHPAPSLETVSGEELRGQWEVFDLTL